MRPERSMMKPPGKRTWGSTPQKFTAMKQNVTQMSVRPIIFA